MYNEWKATGSLLWVHGNRTNFIVPGTITTDCLWFRSGIRKKCPLVSDTLTDIYRRRLYW